MIDYETKIRERIKAYEQCLDDLKNDVAPIDDILAKYNIKEIEDPWYLCESIYNTLDELYGLLGDEYKGERENWLGV